MGHTSLKIIEAKSPSKHILRSYNMMSCYYSQLIAPFEKKARMTALNKANIQAFDKILEVAVGTGDTFLEMVKKIDKSNIITGLDFSPKMLEKASNKLEHNKFNNYRLLRGDARELPFEDNSFDVVYNSYMLDLMNTGDIAAILKEFKRVLKPGGRMILVNLSKKKGSRLTILERVYKVLPHTWAPYLIGGCRPIILAPLVSKLGFQNINRELFYHLFYSEIIIAYK